MAGAAAALAPIPGLLARQGWLQAAPETETEGSELRFVSGILIGAVGFLSHTEWGAYDFQARRLKSVPVGWTTSHYAGIAEGRNELKGYFQGRRAVHTSKRYRVHRKGH